MGWAILFPLGSNEISFLGSGGFFLNSLVGRKLLLEKLIDIWNYDCYSVEGKCYGEKVFVPSNYSILLILQYGSCGFNSPYEPVLWNIFRFIFLSCVLFTFD